MPLHNRFTIDCGTSWPLTDPDPAALASFMQSGREGNSYPFGITGLTTADGRFTIVMPHPERVFRSVQMSWAPDHAGEDSPWMRMFRNARAWVG